jgi:hypothetical protein
MVFAKHFIDFVLGESLPGRNLRPEHPQARFLMAVLSWPSSQAPVGIEVARQALQLNVVRRGRGFARAQQSLFGNDLRAKVLKVTRSHGARKHVKHFNVSWLVLAIFELFI